MNQRALILGIVVSVLLLCIAGTLYFLAGSSVEQRYRGAVALTRQIQQLSSQWSVEIARVKSDPLADFDALAAFIPRVARLKRSLADAARGIPGLPDRLASDINVYLSAVEAKEERIERFKTGHAVVRNSTRYLPLAAANVTRQAQDTGDQALVRSITVLAQDMNLYLATPTDTARARLAEEIERLREASMSKPPTLANGLANLLAHAEVLLARQGPTEELFHGATSGEVSDLSERLVGGLEFELGKGTLASAWYERGMLGVIAVLALFWVGLAVQQRARGTAPAPRSEASAPSGAPPALRAAAGDEAPAPLPLAAGTGRSEEVDEAAEEDLRAAVLASMEADADDEVPARSAAPAPAEAGLSAEAAMQHGFLARCVADSLAASANRIATRMEYLRQTQSRIQHVLQDNDLLLPALEDGVDLDEEIEASSAIAAGVRREMNTLADLARRLASSSPIRNGTLDRDMVDLNACVEDALRATGAEERTRVARRLGNVPEIFASRAEIRLLIIKVIENAVLAVQNLHKRAGTIKVDTARRNDDVLVTVIDNGAGISADKCAKIFNPFYTTRDGATGLGLTLASYLAAKYEGEINVTSLPEQGTVTRITLPLGQHRP